MATEEADLYADARLLIAKVDAKYESPEQRFIKVANILNEREDINNWDIACFAGQFLVSMGIGIGIPALTELAATLAKTIYSAHYNYADQLLGEEKT